MGGVGSRGGGGEANEREREKLTCTPWTIRPAQVNASSLINQRQKDEKCHQCCVTGHTTLLTKTTSQNSSTNSRLNPHLIFHRSTVVSLYEKGAYPRICLLCLVILNSVLLNLSWVWFCSKGLILFQGSDSVRRVWFCSKDCVCDVPIEACGNVTAWRNKPTICIRGVMLQKAIKSPVNFMFYSSGAGYSSVGRASHPKASAILMQVQFLPWCGKGLFP